MSAGLGLALVAAVAVIISLGSPLTLPAGRPAASISDALGLLSPSVSPTAAPGVGSPRLQAPRSSAAGPAPAGPAAARRHHLRPRPPHPTTSAPLLSPSANPSAPPSAPAPSRPAVKGCAADPHSCGYPDATNTGIPAGTTLRSVPGQVSRGKGWHYDPRGWVEVSGSGAVLRDLYIPFNIDVTASNVTITDVRMVVTGDSFGVSLRHTHNVTISHSEIYSPSAGSGRLMVGIKDIYADSVGTTVNADNIWHTSTGVQMDSGLIENSYIHDMGFKSGDHLNGVTSNGSNGMSLVIRHNTIFNNFDQTDAIGLFEDFGAQADRVIEDNLLAGGGYTLYGGANPGGAATRNIRVINNRFARLFAASSGHFGPLTAFARSGAGNVWSGNVWDNTGKPISP